MDKLPWKALALASKLVLPARESSLGVNILERASFSLLLKLLNDCNAICEIS